jgi:hypothetical protein
MIRTTHTFVEFVSLALVLEGVSLAISAAPSGLRPSSGAGTPVATVAEERPAKQGRKGRNLAADAERAGGCWHEGTWYPEGARTPDAAQRLPMSGNLIGPIGHYVCRAGRWIPVME